jgi:hypothetical protein
MVTTSQRAWVRGLSLVAAALFAVTAVLSGINGHLMHALSAVILGSGLVLSAMALGKSPRWVGLGSVLVVAGTVMMLIETLQRHVR